MYIEFQVINQNEKNLYTFISQIRWNYDKITFDMVRMSLTRNQQDHPLNQQVYCCLDQSHRLNHHQVRPRIPHI